jgi:hypothetical protein
MEGFWLLLGHLVGDYIVQNDWMAANKSNPHPGLKPSWSDGAPNPSDREQFRAWMDERNARMDAEDWDGWPARRSKWIVGHFACTIHCLIYTLAIWSCSFWWMPWWGLAVCFVAHWFIDRFRLAGRWMRNVSGQKQFAANFSPPNLPWGVIVVDNTFHLLTLGLIHSLSGGF